jgi:predicted lysophospholipase L1 biosynthesis ABC-type transport system permease subunit
VPDGDGQVVTVAVNDLFYGAAELGSAVAGPEPAGGLAGRPVSALVVLTDGAASSIERVRTVLFRELPDSAPSVTVAQMDAASLQLVSIMQRMVDVGIILSLLIAGCSLAVSVAGGLIERKRPFSLLRITGMPLGHLRRVVLIEAAVPLLLGTVLSAVVGIFAAGLILRAIPTQLALDAPSGSYYAVLAGGVAAAFAIVCATLPLLGRVSRIESARTE